MALLRCLLFLFSPSPAVADFSCPVFSLLDSENLELPHNRRPDRIRLPQAQRHTKELRDPLNRKNG